MFVSILKVLKITFKISKAHTFKGKILKEHKVILKNKNIIQFFSIHKNKKYFELQLIIIIFA